jgi:hypothetical protein
MNLHGCLLLLRVEHVEKSRKRSEFARSIEIHRGHRTIDTFTLTHLQINYSQQTYVKPVELHTGYHTDIFTHLCNNPVWHDMVLTCIRCGGRAGTVVRARRRRHRTPSVAPRTRRCGCASSGPRHTRTPSQNTRAPGTEVIRDDTWEISVSKKKTLHG